MNMNLLYAVLAFGTMAGVFALVLAWAARRFREEGDKLVVQIEELLPQTQCAQCGYPGCKPYAEAIAKGEADITKCQPGGERVIAELADLLGQDVAPPTKEKDVPQIAIIDEQACIGCTLCIKACPTDCIIGAPKMAHTVVTNDCTGCKLCLDPCPVDCIYMEELPPFWEWKAS